MILFQAALAGLGLFLGGLYGLAIGVAIAIALEILGAEEC